jgi:hypothetical protein
MAGIRGGVWWCVLCCGERVSLLERGAETAQNCVKRVFFSIFLEVCGGGF